MRIQLSPCTSCHQPVPTALTYCAACGHEAHARPGRCHCPACLDKPRVGWRDEEEEGARWVFFCSLKPDQPKAEV